MKKIILIMLVITIGFYGCVTMQATPEQEKSLSGVTEYKGLKKDYLYKKSLSFLAKTYNSANDVIQLKDPDTGQIICKGLGKFTTMGMPFYFNYTFIIDIKDGKIRTRFENITGQKMGTTGAPDIKYNWDDIAEYLNNLRMDFNKSINDSKADDNW